MTGSLRVMIVFGPIESGNEMGKTNWDGGMIANDEKNHCCFRSIWDGKQREYRNSWSRDKSQAKNYDEDSLHCLNLLLLWRVSMSFYRNAIKGAHDLRIRSLLWFLYGGQSNDFAIVIRAKNRGPKITDRSVFQFPSWIVSREATLRELREGRNNCVIYCNKSATE